MEGFSIFVNHLLSKELVIWKKTMTMSEKITILEKTILKKAIAANVNDSAGLVIIR